jgi:general secretion pathway protein G
MENKTMTMSEEDSMGHGSCEVERGALAQRMSRAGRSLARGVTLVEVLIVVAIMAVIAGGATVLVFPQFKKARVKTAAMSAGEIKKAADLYQNLNATGDACPTMQDLIASKTLDAKKIDDPWGTPFKLTCVDGEIRVISFGNDKKENTPDDVRDDMKPSELEKIGNL